MYLLKTYQTAILMYLLPFLNAFAGENVWTTNGPAGGSVTCIAIHPQNNQVLYCGTVENGLYNSETGGASWTNMRSDVLDHNMRMIAVHPIAPETIYAATAGGMFKSADAGLSWSLMRPPSGINNEIRTIVIHPTHPNILFAGGPFFSQWKSTDSGESWQQLNVSMPVGIEHFAIDPLNPNTMYFASGSVLYGLGIWKSLDMGETWFPIQNNIDTTFTFGTWIAIDPVEPNILYFSRSDPYDTSGEVLSKSINGGESWFGITPPGLSVSPAIFSVAISPSNHNLVYVCTYGDGVFVSNDGGSNWLQKNRGLQTLEIEECVIDPVSDVIYLGTFKNGIYKSTDIGENWQPISQNINASQCIDLANEWHQPSMAYAAALNGLFRTDDYGENWSRVNIDIPISDAPGSVVIDKLATGWAYVASLHKAINTGAAGFWRTIDDGTTWQFSNSGLRGDISYVDMAISYGENGARRILLASESGLYRSDNLGESWEICQRGLPTTPHFMVVEVAPNNQNVIIVGEGLSAQNRLFISFDRGTTWQQTSNLPSVLFAHVSAIAFAPDAENHFYVSSAYNGLFETNDAGNNWIDITNGIPIDPYDPQVFELTGLTINAHNERNLFVLSSHVGIFQTHNGGQPWFPFNAGLDTSNIFGKVYFSAFDTSILYFTSQHTSVWSIHRTVTGVEEESPPKPGEITLSAHPNPFNAQTTITYSLPRAGVVALSVYNVLGQKAAVLLEGIQPAGEHRLVWDAATFPSGVYFARLDFAGESRISKMVLLK